MNFNLTKMLVGIALMLVFFQKPSAQTLRPPAVPLITHDPYFSIWSTTDELMASPTRHWTGTDHSMLGVLKVDGKLYRFLGSKSDAYAEILPAGDAQNFEAKFTETAPTSSDWMDENFDDSQWKNGFAPFGNIDGFSKNVWQSHDIWIRRAFVLDKNWAAPILKLKHDDDVEVFLNGEKIYEAGCCSFKYTMLPLVGKLKNKLKIGKNLLAIHVVNTGGGALLDAGIVEKMQPNNDHLIVAQQKSMTVSATQTEYEFGCGNVNLHLTFTSPLLLGDLKILSRPISYIHFSVQSNDGAAHEVALHFGVSTDLAANVPSQPISVQKIQKNNFLMLKAGTKEQPILQKKGDDLRIDWGFLYVAASKNSNLSQTVSTEPVFFQQNEKDVLEGKSLMLNTEINLGKVGSSAKSQTIVLAYDDLFSVKYFGKNLEPWWKTNGTSIEQEIASALRDYSKIIKKCKIANEKIYRDALEAGGKQYAELCALAYRQAVAAHKLVKSPDGETLFLSKENFSNGSINTVDVTYPSAPLFLAYNPELLKGMLNGIFYYSESGKWTKPFAAHDLGTYPIANGQTYPEDMPVEECGNMVILATAICIAEKKADYAKKHWKTLTDWVNYLKINGFDPTNQLCTDDFAGHLARNANLSIKSIIAMAGYGKMAGMLGDPKTEAACASLAKDWAARWVKMADADDHFSLTFDGKNTWSQKYNMVWDKVLQLDVFPKSVAKKELNFYLEHQNKYGLPLDSRKTYTKSDWILWTATLADNDADFQKLLRPVFDFVNETPSRVPISDWHETKDGTQVGFQARSVVGGYFMKVLEKKLK